MTGKFCGKTYYSTIGGQDVIVWCDQEPGHDGDCGPFVHPPLDENHQPTDSEV